MAQTYVSKRTGVKAKLINSNSAMATLEYEDGTIKEFSHSTLRRWWTLDETAEESEQEVIQEEHSPELDIETDMVVTEELEQLQLEMEELEPELHDLPDPADTAQEMHERNQARIAKNRAKAEVNPVKVFTEELAKTKGMQVEPVPERLHVKLKYMNKVAVAFNYANKSITLMFKSKYVGELEGATSAKHLFDQRVRIENLDSKSEQLINEILARSIEFLDGLEEAKTQLKEQIKKNKRSKKKPKAK